MDITSALKGVVRIGIGLLVAALSACGGSAPEQDRVGGSSSVRRNEQGPPALSGSETVRGRIVGLRGVVATVTLGNQAEVLGTTRTDADGNFTLSGVPYGTYFVKAEADGLVVSAAQVVTVNRPTPAANFGALTQILPAPPGLVFSAAGASATEYSFHWDTISGGQEATMHINTPPVVQFRNESIPQANHSAAANLYSNYGVVLSDDDVKWTSEAAARLLTTFGTLPTVEELNGVKPFRPSKWVLTDQIIAGDIKIERGAIDDTVTLSSAALVYATPRLVFLDGVPGRFFSKRLHHAALRFATKDGSDSAAAHNILYQRYGVITNIHSSFYSALTDSTTREAATSFAAFRPQELIDLISAMEEMPEGFHKIKGLNYLLRRAYGQTNPLDRNIAAAAFSDAGYIEFTDSALDPTRMSPQRVILHEKTHFLWAKVFSDRQKNDWIALGGWYRNPQDTSKWLTRLSTGFVSAYAHAVSPDEDMAESVADYILNPAVLQSRAIAKFNYIRDAIFHGDRFVPVIREDLTFTVVDLAPDYTAPGKVKSIDISVRGGPTDYKWGTVSVELFGDSSPMAGARQCAYTLTPPSRAPDKTWSHVLNGKNADGSDDNAMSKNHTKLYGVFQISPLAESGYYQLSSFVCTDIAGNKRTLNAGDIGNASVYINNSAKALSAPAYEPGSMSVSEVAPRMVDGHRFRQVEVKFRIQPHPVWIYPDFELKNLDQPSHRISAKPSFDSASRTVTALFAVPDYYPSGRYGVVELAISDEAGNLGRQSFPDSVSKEAASFAILVNDRPDISQPPELDVNRISVTATPSHPAAPDGETTVKIVYYARDDISGLGTTYIHILSPLGNTINPSFHTTNVTGVVYHGPTPDVPLFPGDPTVWQRYEARFMLPAGSAPGVWGIRGMHLLDKAGFGKFYDFTELMHFEVTDK